jgi:phospholipid/cholesterol/gamma-HCH transport system permease protein
VFFITFLMNAGRLGLFFVDQREPYLSVHRSIGANWDISFLHIGYFSLPVVGLTAVYFTGMVLALQSHTSFARFNAEGAVATVVVLSMTRELGPVLAGLMVAGRVWVRPWPRKLAPCG